MKALELFEQTHRSLSMVSQFFFHRECLFGHFKILTPLCHFLTRHQITVNSNHMIADESTPLAYGEIENWLSYLLRYLNNLMKPVKLLILLAFFPTAFFVRTSSAYRSTNFENKFPRGYRLIVILLLEYNLLDRWRMVFSFLFSHCSF